MLRVKKVMKIKNLLCSFIFSFFFYAPHIKSEGLLPQTAVKKALEHSYIQRFFPLKTNHIPQLNILVHNTIPIVVVYFPVIVAKAFPVIQSCLTAAATFLGIHFAKKAKNKSKMSSMDSYSSNNYDSYYPDPNDPNDDKNKTNDKEHPHGIYRDAPYHHKNSSGSKSKSPMNGQHCLDYSLPTETNQRIAIEGKNFILLKYTSPGNYHGYVITWKELDQSIRNILVKHGFVKISGKIIKQIMEKSSL